MPKLPSFNAGDRVAFSAKFCRSTEQHTGRTPHIKGTFVRVMPECLTHGYVHWDDEAERIARAEGNFAEADYREHVAANGELVALANICRVDSPRYALSDL